MRIALKPQPKAMWAIIAFMISGSAVILIGAWLFDRYQRSPDFDLPVRFGVIKLYLLAGMSLVLGLVLALVQAAGGGAAKDTVLTAANGRLTIDRYVSGDHVVREYWPDEISAIWVDSAIGVDARLSPFSLALLTPSDVQVAVAEIIGTVFWGEDAVVARKVKSARAADGVMKILVSRRS